MRRTPTICTVNKTSPFQANKRTSERSDWQFEIPGEMRGADAELAITSSQDRNDPSVVDGVHTITSRTIRSAQDRQARDQEPNVERQAFPLSTNR